MVEPLFDLQSTTSDVLQSFWKLYLNKLSHLDSPPHLIDNFEFQLELTYAQQLAGLNNVQRQFLPDFLIISPSKTGTTWLNYTLTCHPDIFIPAEKELKFFSTYWRWLGVDWYLRYFQDAVHLKKGEATPAYAILPSHIIQLILSLKPELKLIYLMRDPLDRAWSQAKHLYKYHQALFTEYENEFEAVSDEKFIQNFTNIGTLFHGDYLGSLQRWLSFFPKQQIFVGFYEAIKHDPVTLLSNIFDFLEVKNEVDWSKVPLTEKFLPGLEKEAPPNLKSHLRSIYKKRTGELVLYLKEEFDLEPPTEWSNTLEGDEILSPVSVEEDYNGFKIFLYQENFYALTKDGARLDFEQPNTRKSHASPLSFVADSPQAVKCLIDQSLSFQEQLLTTASLGEIYVSDPVLVERNYWGFNLVFYKGKFYALAQTLGHLNLAELNQDRLDEYQQANDCRIGLSLHEIKRMVDQLILVSTKSEQEVIKSRYWFHIMKRITRNKFFCIFT